MTPKKHLFLLLILGLGSAAKAQFNFTITNITGSSSITCAIDTINVSAVSNATGNTTYSWVSGTISLSGSNVIITKPGNYVVTATSGSSSLQKNLAIGINTVTPMSSAPSTFVVSSSSPPSFTFVAISPTVNITHFVYSPTGGTMTASSTTLIYVPTAGPGTYTHCIVDGVNGCASCQPSLLGGGSPATTGLSDLAQQSRIMIYPNPNSGFFQVIIEGPENNLVEVFTLSGQLIKSQLTASRTLHIDIHDQSKGIYFLKVTSEKNSSQYLKLLVE